MKLLLDNFGDELARLAQEAVEIKVVIAFLTEGGLDWLPDDKAPSAEFIVGVDLRITSPRALKNLQDRGACVRVFQESGRMFHPKAIYIKTVENEFLIVGSNNLTSSGISSNHEVSVLTNRNEETESAFADFLGHFEKLRIHNCCGIPDEKFYQSYKQSDIQRHLVSKIRAQEAIPLLRPEHPIDSIADADITTLGEYIKLLSHEFPNLDRSSGRQIINTPLKLLNDDKFRPLFEEIVSSASQGRLKAQSSLNIGGKWYTIPNILATNEEQEPWENTRRRGRLVLQLHFSEDFSQAFLSLNLKYNLHRSVHGGEMPLAVSQRFQKLLQHFENFSDEANVDGPIFKHWTYKDEILWAKPIMTFSYNVDALPEDRVPRRHLSLLATALNSAAPIS